jgi:tetratricopeptide (TPR) repeat protein
MQPALRFRHHRADMPFEGMKRMRRHTVILFACLVSAGWGAPATPPSPTIAGSLQQRLEKVRALLHAGQLQEAHEALDGLLAGAPDDPHYRAALLAALGKIEFRQGLFRSAARHHQLAYDLFVKHIGPASEEAIGALCNLGASEQAMGDWRRSEQLLQRGLALIDEAAAPERRAQVLISVATAMANNSRYEEADQVLRQAARVLERTRNPSAVTAWNNLAAIYRKQRRYAEAFEALSRAGTQCQGREREQFECALIVANTATLHYLTEDYRQSEEEFRRAVLLFDATHTQAHPSFVTVLESYADTLKKLGKREQASLLRDRAAALRRDTALESNGTGLTVDWRDLAGTR